MRLIEKKVGHNPETFAPELLVNANLISKKCLT